MDLKWVILRPAQKCPRSQKEAFPKSIMYKSLHPSVVIWTEKIPIARIQKAAHPSLPFSNRDLAVYLWIPYSLVCERLCLALDGTFHNYDSFIISIILSRWTMSCHPSASSPCSQAFSKSIYGGKSRDRPHHIVTGELCHATHLRHLLVVRYQ
jgi:hypothetical protein